MDDENRWMIDDDRWILGTFSEWILRYSSGARLPSRGGRDITWNGAVISTGNLRSMTNCEKQTLGTGFSDSFWIGYVLSYDLRIVILFRFGSQNLDLGSKTDRLDGPDVVAGHFLLGRWMCGCWKKPWEERSNALLLCACERQWWLC